VVTVAAQTSSGTVYLAVPVLVGPDGSLAICDEPIQVCHNAAWEHGSAHMGNVCSY
jgi:hypothetical protein